MRSLVRHVHSPEFDRLCRRYALRCTVANVLGAGLFVLVTGWALGVALFGALGL